MFKGPLWVHVCDQCVFCVFLLVLCPCRPLAHTTLISPLLVCEMRSDVTLHTDVSYWHCVCSVFVQIQAYTKSTGRTKASLPADWWQLAKILHVPERSLALLRIKLKKDTVDTVLYVPVLLCYKAQKRQISHKLMHFSLTQCINSRWVHTVAYVVATVGKIALWTSLTRTLVWKCNSAPLW